MVNQSCAPFENHRKVKTVLLCKVKPDVIRKANAKKEQGVYNDAQKNFLNQCDSYPEIYRDVYRGPHGDALRFISVGNADAFSIYDTIPEEELNSSLQRESACNWFSKLYADKQEIILNTREHINYHPIHLVSNAQKVSSIAKMDYRTFPFCIVTLIYGIRDTDNASIGSMRSSYEVAISEFLKEEADKNSETIYEIYNAVNICDAAIIWYSQDIPETLQLSAKLTEKKFARKTFTLIGFQMDPYSGLISGSVYNAIMRKDQSYYARVQGSIRNLQEYRSIRNAILGIHGQGQAKDYLICGQSDFSILLPGIRSWQLVNLLKFFMDRNNSCRIAEACWDIHTELMYEDSCSQAETALISQILYNNSNVICNNSEQIDNEKFPNIVPILEQIYQDCQKLPAEIKAYPWFGAFYEQLNVHATIDQHPILHGPSFLVYGLAKIAVSYFQQAQANPAVKAMLRKSLPSIQQFIRSWTDLTDQILRIDDLVFHGFGNNAALSTTLPECALDFYHAFLLKCVDFLVLVDEKDGRCVGNDRRNYKYDFLLLPELHQGVCIEQMFDTDCLNRSFESNDRRLLWPLEQAYLVKFPIETVFSPDSFFMSLMHECFHYFGDAGRLRADRTDYICAFMSAWISSYFGISGKDASCKSFFKAIYYCLKFGFQNNNPEPNGSETKKILENSLRELFTAEGLDLLLKMAPEVNTLTFSRQSMLVKWADGANALGTMQSAFSAQKINSDLDSITSDCLYYFKECYADYKMILLLGLKPSEYLKLFETIAATMDSNAQLIRDAQRIAIVLAACSETEVPDFEQKQLLSALSRYKQHLNGRFSSSEITVLSQFIDIVTACMLSLTDKSQPLSLDKDADSKYLIAIHPPVVLMYVLDYLKATSRAIHSLYSNPEIQEEALDIRDDYDFFFRKGNFLCNRYFSIIRKNHEAVRQDVEKSKHT